MVMISMKTETTVMMIMWMVTKIMTIMMIKIMIMVKAFILSTGGL